MPVSKHKASLCEVARRVFEEAITTALGPTCNTVITFHLKQKFGKDAYEVFVDNPRAFYTALEEIFGAGAESMISLVGNFLVRKYGINCNAEKFVSLVVKSDKTARNELEEILSDIADRAEN